MGLYGLCEHVAKFEHVEAPDGRRNGGYLNWLAGIREVSAVTGACVALRRDVYRAVGGLDEGMAVGCNDIDLCLRLRSRGLKILFDARIEMIHHESWTRGGAAGDPHPTDTERFHATHRNLLKQTDPFFSPLLSRYHRSAVPDQIARAPVDLQPRTTMLPEWSQR
jgi:GT2 family glycosyltransferase